MEQTKKYAHTVFDGIRPSSGRLFGTTILPPIREFLAPPSKQPFKEGNTPQKIPFFESVEENFCTEKPQLFCQKLFRPCVGATYRRGSKQLNAQFCFFVLPTIARGAKVLHILTEKFITFARFFPVQ